MTLFLKQYQSPTAVLIQWWCLFAARHPRTALALKVMGLYLILAAVTDPVVHADDGQKNSGGGDAFTMFLDTSNLKDKEGIEINRYSTAATCEYLGGITRQALNDRINKHTILRLKDGAGRNGYPIFQFSNGTVDPNIQQIIQTLLDGHFSEWQTALWLTSPSLMYNGASPLEYLRTSPKNFGQVLAHAENDVNNLYANS